MGVTETMMLSGKQVQLQLEIHFIFLHRQNGLAYITGLNL